MYLQGKVVENTEVRGKKADNCFGERKGGGSKAQNVHKQHAHHI